MPKSSAAEQSGESSTQTRPLLDEIIAKGRMAHDDSQQDYARDMLAEFATQVPDEGMAVDKDTVAMINDRISQIDALISDQLNQIIHHPELQKLEATWRGLHQLVSNRDQRAAQAAPAERRQERTAERPGEGGRVRPERTVQEDLRRGNTAPSADTPSAC